MRCTTTTLTQVPVHRLDRPAKHRAALTPHLSIPGSCARAVVNWWLIHRCGLKPNAGHGVIGLVAETRCTYHASVAYPSCLQLGLAVVHLGRSSVRYQIGVFTRPDADRPAAAAAPPETDGRAAAVGHFVHVYVDAVTRRPQPLPDALRAGLAPLVVHPPAAGSSPSHARL